MSEWRPVVGFSGLYEVSNRGVVRSCTRFVVCVDPLGRRTKRLRMGKLMRYDRGGRNKAYQRVYLRAADGRKVHAYVHRLVCEAWHGPRPFDGAVIRHLNDIQTDNRQENLQWGTPEENREDQIRNRHSPCQADEKADEAADVELAGASW